MPPGRAARAMLIWPQRDVPCIEIAYLQLTYASFSDETSSSPSTAARTRCLTCTPDSCAAWQMSLLHVQHVLFYHLDTSYMQPMHLSGTGLVSQGHMQSFSQQLAPCSAKSSSRKMGAGSMRQLFWLWPVQSPVWGRDGACSEAHLQLSHFNLLCSRRYALSIFFQCLQGGSFLQYACDPVTTSWSDF